MEQGSCPRLYRLPPVEAPFPTGEVEQEAEHLSQVTPAGKVAVPQVRGALLPQALLGLVDPQALPSAS